MLLKVGRGDSPSRGEGNVSKVIGVLLADDHPLLRNNGLPVRVLALSAYDEDRYVRGMLEAGAVGYYLLKEEAPETIVAAAKGGGGYFSPPVAAKVAAWARGAEPAVAGLTDRELEVLRLLARGWDNRRMAKGLTISERTVRFHLRNIYDKIEVHSRTEAAIWAVRHGLGEEDRTA